jgi:hypothetical protein
MPKQSTERELPRDLLAGELAGGQKKPRAAIPIASFS